MSLVKVPGSVVNATVNCFELGILTTVKFLSNPESWVADVLFVLLTLTTCTSDPTLKLCGSSVVIVATFKLQVALEINLKFLKSFLFERSPEPKYFDTSLDDPMDVLVSCRIYPSTGGLAVAEPSFGITYLTL